MAGFHIEHFGCRAARADGEAIAGNLRALSEREPLAADVVIVNTCSVTAEADRAARAFIRRAHRRNPAARIVVTGCYAQRAPQELAAMAGVAAVVGNSHQAFAAEIVLDLMRGEDLARGPELTCNVVGQSSRLQPLVPVASLLAPSAAQFPGRESPAPIWADDRFAHSFIEDAHGGDAQLAPGEQTRPNLKIQEGCGNRCTFCVIPFTRGPSRSLPHAVVMRKVESFVAAGGKELVLSGINLGRWGQDFEGLDRRSLAGLVREILEKTALPRLRLSSIEPMDWNAELIGLMREYGGHRLARHAHLPLQSGSDAVLRRMHRRYRPWHYAEKVAALADACGSHLTLGTDVMVGFPGESDGEFAETVEFLHALPFGYLHLFPFSARPGTLGWALHSAAPVAPAIVEERMAVLRMLAAEKTTSHRRQFVGRTLEAITLHTPPAVVRRDSTAALTENFLPVELAGRFAANRLLQVQVRGLNAGGALECSSDSPVALQ
jgi:threonylcarbamoyladenosine tRNA methylthiotransferase MtaB